MAEAVYNASVVGTYYDANAKAHGFLFDGTNYSTLDVPASITTNASGPNTYFGTYALGISSNGIVGWYTSPDGANHGFLLTNRVYTTLDEPNAFLNTVASGISGSNIVGTFIDTGNVTHGFLLSGTNYTTLDDPIALNAFFGGATDANGVDGNNIVGFYSAPANNGFLFDGTNYTTLDFPNAGGSSETLGISGTNIVGFYSDSLGHSHGMLYDGTGYTSFDFPGSAQTYATGIWDLTMSGYYVDSNNFNHGFIAVPTSSIKAPAVGSLRVTITPTGAVASGAQWQVDGGALQNSGATVTNLTNGLHAVSFGPAAGWTPPANQSVTITNGITNLTGLYTPSAVSSDGLILLTNGQGGIQHASWPAALVTGNKYTVKAVPAAGYLFESWVGGITPPYAIVSTSASFTFTMQAGMLLEANFVTDPFLTALGSYRGLFAPANANRAQTNSGSFDCVLTKSGAFSGNLRIGAQAIPLSGRFGPDGNAAVISRRRNQPALTTSLQLDAVHQAVTGTVTDGNFVSALLGYQAVFNARNKATNYAGRYTLIISGTNAPTVGPSGTSWGAVQVQPTGAITLAGSLADGTPVNQTSFVSSNGYWPMYLPLYNGNGSMWSWNLFSNGVITSPVAASWINAGNSGKTALYQSGFTNQNVIITGATYQPGNEPLLVLINGTLTLQGGGLPAPLTNQVVNGSSDRPNFLGGSNNVNLMINPTTGVVSGTFRSATISANPVKISGVLESNLGFGMGYFLGTSASGTFLLTPQ
jgi:hypothetical protein